MNTAEKTPLPDCPECGSDDIYRTGLTVKGEQQRYLCKRCRCSFQLHYVKQGYITEVREKALALHLAGHTQSAISATLGLSHNTIRKIVKGHPRGRLTPCCPACQSVETVRFGKAEDGVTQRYRCWSCRRVFMDAESRKAP